MVRSATRGDPVIEGLPFAQAVTALAGLGVMLLVVVTDYSLLKNVAIPLYALTLASLAAVLGPALIALAPGAGFKSDPSTCNRARSPRFCSLSCWPTSSRAGRAGGRISRRLA